MPLYRVVIHRDIEYDAPGPNEALNLAIADLMDNLAERLQEDGEGGWTSSNADVVPKED